MQLPVKTQKRDILTCHQLTKFFCSLLSQSQTHKHKQTHNDMNCFVDSFFLCLFHIVFVYFIGCHLDINLENILLQNADFVINALDGTVSINKNINVKLCDFGRSEIFKDGVFECAKPGMSCLEDGYSFDARKTDVFDLGMCLYHCCVGIAHEHKEEVDDDDDIASDVEIETNGHSAVRKGQLNEVIKSKIRNKKIENLLSALLKMDEKERFEIADVLRHEWFTGYYAKNEKRIHKRSKSQKIKIG